MNLYIIGNGYDIEKNLPTRYSDFAKWVEKKYPKVYKKVLKIFKLDENWGNFEDRIANSFQDIEKILKECSGLFYESNAKDKSTIFQDCIDDKLVQRLELTNLVKEWIQYVLGANKINKEDTNEYIVNFNYTNIINGPNILNIHETVYSNFTLGFGHTEPRKLENSFTNTSKIRDVFPDPKAVYNQLSKNMEVNKTKLRIHLYNKNIDKIIFFGFSFGKQDIGYFHEFDNDVEVDFYIKNDDKNINEIKKRVSKKFANTNFIDSREWKGFEG